ncbi:sugar transporter [Bacteroides sp. 214]|uniref:lipopolysaccharide biosynthesis protein n=1 Tax=Bacteroides sp. 214 TaxID=2302935 RepID=UPI0013D187D3|nr:sugar transporter [Bacteroides sp. 214]NDW12748.1 sugar transporter [Bacteroides sp. 214]
MSKSRLQKSLLNAKVNLFFYMLTLFVSFFSRKIFLDCLGDDFIGLTGTLNNILSLLNLAELGIAYCICFFLYKPLQENNHEEINEIISLFGYIYRKIGFALIICGGVLSFFFPLMFGNSNVGIGIVYFAFFSFLGSSLITYFINYRQVLLTADQKNYIVSAYFQTGALVKTIIQILLAYYYKNLYLWVAIEFVFSIVTCIILNKKINQEYPWLTTNLNNGKSLLKKYPEVFKKTKQFFMHKMKDFVLNRSDEIWVFAFVSLKMVAYYGNYTMIVNKVITLINIAFDGVGAGVGNLIAEDNKQNTMKVFWELIALRYFITGTVAALLYFFMEPFISIWLGDKYIMSNLILCILIFNLFISLTSRMVEIFVHAHGLYADTWAAWAETILNIAITVIVASQYGIIGILLGKACSMTLIAVFWKPYYLFKSGFRLPVWSYWKGVAPHYIAFVVCLVIFIPIKNMLIDIHAESLWSMAVKAIIILMPFTGLYFFILLKTTIGMKYAINRIPLVAKLRSKK